MVFDVEVEEVVEPDGVVGGNDELVEGDSLGNDERRSGLRPVLPNKLLRVVKHVEYINLLRNLHSEYDRRYLIVRVQLESLNNVRGTIVQMHEKLTELLAGGLFKSCSQRPNATEHNQVGQHVIYLLRHFGLFLVIGLDVGAQQLQK